MPESLASIQARLWEINRLIRAEEVVLDHSQQQLRLLADQKMQLLADLNATRGEKPE